MRENLLWPFLRFAKCGSHLGQRRTNTMSDNWKKFLKMALGTGLMMVETSRASKHVRDRMDDWGDSARDKYDDIVDRVGRVGDALSGRRNYGSHFGSFLVGVGIGAGLGLLFAPASGEETRNAIWDQASDMKDRVVSKASDFRDRAAETASQYTGQGAGDAGRREPGNSTSQPYSRPA